MLNVPLAGGTDSSAIGVPKAQEGRGYLCRARKVFLPICDELAICDFRLAHRSAFIVHDSPATNVKSLSDKMVGMETSRPKLRWYQYSLRSLFVFVTLVCIVLGLYIGPKHRRHQAVVAIEDAGGTFQYVDVDIAISCGWDFF